MVMNSMSGSNRSMTLTDIRPGTRSGDVARRLLGSVRTYDYVGRYGGEEFLIIIPSCDPLT